MHIKLLVYIDGLKAENEKVKMEFFFSTLSFFLLRRIFIECSKKVRWELMSAIEVNLNDEDGNFIPLDFHWPPNKSPAQVKRSKSDIFDHFSCLEVINK